MKSFFLLFITCATALAEVPGLTIPNSFQVDREGNIFRGREPRKLVSELAPIGITDVLIFKNEIKDEVQKEILALKEAGITSYHIPFAWKDYPSMKEACEQVVEAISIIKKVKQKNGKIFFHCTAGEDRTGMLAGLYRMIEENQTAEYVFKNEMCPRGYSNGNKNKPWMVTGAIQKELTPLYLALAEKINNGKLTKNSCASLKIKPTTLKCD